MLLLWSELKNNPHQNPLEGLSFVLHGYLYPLKNRICYKIYHFTPTESSFSPIDPKLQGCQNVSF